MAIEIIRADMTDLPMYVDALVNTANPYPVVGRGLDHSIYEKAGPDLLSAREKIGEIPAGESRITTSYDLAKKSEIHHSFRRYPLAGRKPRRGRNPT